jgi:hypothetical protein
VIRPHRIGINSPLAKVFGVYNPRSEPMTAATGAVRNSRPRPGLGGKARREQALVGVEIPAGQARDEQIALGGGQDGGRVDQPVQIATRIEQGRLPVTVINDPRENAERRERAVTQPS